MTRLLLDENVPLASERLLRDAGHDVARVAPGDRDSAVLAQARAERRILVTHDRDFGLLAYRDRSSVPPGIVLLRSHPTRPESTAVALLAVLDTSGVELDGKLTVIEPGRIRQRRLR